MGISINSPILKRSVESNKEKTENKKRYEENYKI